uniref:Sorting nexin-13 n=1 Tax=Rhabditophanes sp. KR3021 TaxID=114890 RepID=A0AC35TIR7_9BILA
MAGNELVTSRTFGAILAAITCITVFSCYFDLIYFQLSTGACFVAGFAFVVYKESGSLFAPRKKELEDFCKSFTFFPGLKDVLEALAKSKDVAGYTERHSMSSSPAIDSALEQILNYFTRDFIDNWYEKIGTGTIFQDSLKRMIRRTVAAFNYSLGKLDWTELITRDLADDIASHFRLYRKAKERLESKKSDDKRADDLESLFFDIELEMEKSYCRDLVSTTPQYELTYFRDVTDVILHLLMPAEDFRCRPLRFIIRDILVNRIFIPMFDKFSNPDFVNYIIVWLLSEINIDPESFIVSLESSQSVQELEAILESIDEEMNALKTKDNTREYIDIIQQQLASLDFAATVIKRKMLKLTSNPEADLIDEPDVGEEMNTNMIQLPITIMLTNSIAINFFSEFLQKNGKQAYIDCYLAIEGFKASAEHQFRAFAGGEAGEKEVHKIIKDAALFLYHQFLSTEATTKVDVDEAVINRFLARLRNDEPTDEKVLELLSKDEKFYPAFKRSDEYRDLLIELGVISSADSIEEDLTEEDNKSLSSLGSFTSLEVGVEPINTIEFPKDYSKNTVIVESLGVGQSKQESFVCYNVRVSRTSKDGRNISTWNTVRRYTDFHLLNQIVKKKYPKLKHISFPAKKTFNNFDGKFLEKRTSALNVYMNTLMAINVIEANPGLEEIVHDFISQKTFSGVKEGFPAKVISSIFNPVVTGVKAISTAVTSVPDQVIDGVSKVGSGLNRASQVLRVGVEETSVNEGLAECSRVAANIKDETFSDNIPLRVLLLFVDEVFGLRGRNQWFRRSLTTTLHQIISATLGSSINRKIIDLVNFLTSSDQVSQYLVAFRETIWPNGYLNTRQEPKSLNHALKTRLFARTQMLAAIPDELRLFIGVHTATKGISNISNALQNRHLNRRLAYVILERLLVKIFPNNKFDKLLPQLHSKSPRTKLA